MLSQHIESCANYESYPANLKRPDTPKRVLDAQELRLRNDELRLFDEDVAHVVIREAVKGNDRFQENVRKSLSTLKEHLGDPSRPMEKDPISRHIFISAGSSRDPLYCKGSMFKYICSYQEVSPNFLKLVHSLGEQVKARKFHEVGFCEEYLLKTSPRGELDIPELGRSGSEFRNFYQLQAMEFSNESGGIWVRRQATVFHSFDLETARCFWLTIKGDNELKKRITESQDSRAELQPHALAELPGSFNASMLTHLTHLEWCTEGWRSAIGARESRLRGILDKAESVLINPFNIKKSFSMSINESPGKSEAAAAYEECQSQAKSLLRYEKILAEFSVFGFQNLTTHTLELQDAKLAITLNLDILRNIRNSYQSFASSEECPEEIRQKCSAQLRSFIRRVRSLETELSIECRRADALISQLQEAKPLYDSILQFRNTEMNKLIALNARYSSIRMESTGERTERLTSSMHVITFFTLLLLPGTFLGSIFSTDIIAGGKEKGSAVQYDKALGVLFVSLCLPMMLCTLILWGLYMWCMKRRRQQQLTKYMSDYEKV